MKNIDIDVTKYPLDLKLTFPRRLAHFLNWAAKFYPRQFCSPQLVAKAINGLAKMPKANDNTVTSLGNKKMRAAEILREEYGRDLVSAKGLGMRATADDADALVTVMPKRAKRLESAQQGLAKTAAIIDIAKVPDSAELKEWKLWFKRDVKAALKDIESSLPKLLNPAQKAEAEAEAK